VLDEVVAKTPTGPDSVNAAFAAGVARAMIL
jgi:hypothetical protein